MKKTNKILTILKQKIDIIIAFILSIITLISIYHVYNTNLLPFTYRMIAIVFIVIITMLCIALTLKKMDKIFMYIRRGCIIVLCICLSTFSYYLSSLNNATKQFTTTNTTKVENILVLSLSSSSISELSDLENTTIAYQNGTDIDNAEYAIEILEDELNNVSFEGVNNYIELSDELLNEEVDAIIISEAYVDSLDETLPDFFENTMEVYCIEREVENTVSYSSDIDLTSDVFTVLVSASDGKTSTDSNSLTDVNMLLIVNPTLNHVEMISFPRDSFIPNVALNSVSDKLTHTGVYGGIINTVDSIENLIGFEIDFYVKVNFNSLIEIVDTLGGIEVDVLYSFSEQDSNRSFAEEDLIYLYEGLQTLDGEEALAYARHRKSEGVGDVGRTKAQQQIVAAIINETLTIEGATKIPTLLSLMTDYVTTNISEEQLNAFVSYEIENMTSWTYGFTTLENGYSATLATASYPSMGLSCYLLAESDVQALYELYYMHTNPTTFADFNFDITDLTIDSDYTTNYDIVYTTSDYSSYIVETLTDDDELEDLDADSENEEVEDNTDVEEDSDDQSIIYHTVTFYDMNGLVLGSYSVASGDSVSAPTPTVIDGYEFSYWDSDFSSITSDLSIYAVYTETTITDDTTTPDEDTTLDNTGTNE